jgi:hypothetical protein
MDLPIETIVSAYLADEPIESLAKRYNVSPQDIANKLFDNAFDLDGISQEILDDLRIKNGEIQCCVCEKCYKIADYPLVYRRPSFRCAECRYKGDIAKKYGMTFDECDALLTSTDRCQICDQKPEKKLVVDHCHKTGKVRGLLCQQCNLGLGAFRDNQDILDRAKLYLNKS